MLMGFVDGDGRKYDLNFRTLRTRLLDEDGDVVLEEGEILEGRAPCEAEASVRFATKSLPFLLCAPGELTATDRRFLFVVGPEARRPAGQFTFLNVVLPLHPRAVESFFTAQGGREYLEFMRDDVIVAHDARGGIEVELRGPAPGRPAETATYVATFAPAAATREVLDTLL